RPRFLLTTSKRGVYLPSNMSTSDLKPFRILIRSSNWLGDAVMSVPAVRAIRQGRPDAHLSILAPAGLVAMWKLISEIDEVIPLESRSLLSAVRAIRRHGRFDAAILFPNSLRAALEAWLAGVPRRTGYRGHRRKWLLNQIIRRGGRAKPPQHQAEHYLRIAEQLGGSISTTTPLSLLPVGRPAATVTPIRIGLCPGAE